MCNKNREWHCYKTKESWKGRAEEMSIQPAHPTSSHWSDGPRDWIQASVGVPSLEHRGKWFVSCWERDLPWVFYPLEKNQRILFFFLDLSRKTLPFLGGGLSWCWNIHLLFSLAVTTQDQKSFSFSGVYKNLMLCQPCWACTDVPAQHQSAAFQCTWGLNLLPQHIPHWCFQSLFVITEQWKCREARRLLFASIPISRHNVGTYFTE